MNKQSTTKLFSTAEKIKNVELYPTPNFFRDKRRKDERFASVIGFLNADYYALNGCVQSEVNKKHSFEDTVEKKNCPPLWSIS